MHIVMQTTPDTVEGLILGFAMAAIVAVLYLVSLFVRFRSAKRDEAVIQQLKDEG